MHISWTCARFSWRAILALSFVLSTQVAAFHCPFDGSPGWPDICDGKTDSETCKPYSPLPHDGSYKSWASARVKLVKKLWGGMEPPRRTKPDVGPTPFTTPVVFGNCMCLLRGECPASTCAKVINASTFSWNISIFVNESYGSVDLSSMVIHSLNTSGVATGNSEKFEYNHGKKNPPTPTAQWPNPSQPPLRLSDTLVIFHDGHTVTNGCHYDVEETVDWLNRLGKFINI